jgi:hypothetical protein
MIMTASGVLPKVEGDALYAADGFTSTRGNGIYIGSDAGGNTGTTGAISGVITIPANTIKAGVLVMASCYSNIAVNGGAEEVTVEILSDASSPPTTSKQSQVLHVEEGSGTAVNTVSVTFTKFITGLTWSSINYVMINCPTNVSSNTVYCTSVTVIGF